MSAPSSAKMLEVSQDAARAAGRVLLKYFGKKIQVREKQGAGLVTQADLEAENAALAVLRRGLPDFGVLSEEAGILPAKNSGRFIIDPLDGTTNFVHGFPMFCVSIAAEWDGELKAGVIYHPVLDETYTAIKSKGAKLDGKKIQVSKTKLIENSLLTTGFTYRKDDWLRKEMRAFEELSRQTRALRRPGSAALDLAYTARGVFDGFWERRLSPWDVAAGALLVEEAGGKVTDFQGKKFKVDAGELLASNANLHARLLSVISGSLR